jgi:hypothetical protein
MMAYRHLVLAYVITWALQLGYMGILAMKWRREKRGAAPADAFSSPARGESHGRSDKI